MTFQTGSNILAALRAESTTGVAATVTGAQQIRITDSPGLELRRADITSQEKRDDGNTSMGRSGGKSVDGSYNMELSAGGAVNTLIEAVMRSTFATSTSITFVTLTAVTFATNALESSAGDFIAEGIKVGDIFTISGSDTTANNDLNKQVLAVTSGTLTAPDGSFTAAATADTAGTLVIRRKLAQGTQPVRSSYTVEQYDQDIDLSELFLGVRVVGMRLSFRPGAMAVATFTMLGLDRTALATGTSPYFTSPSVTTNLGLIADDSSIRYNGSSVATFTGFDLDFQITAAGEPVIGSFVSPDIFDNDLAVTGSITGLRQDFSNLTLFDAETEFEVSILLEEPGTTPKRCLAVYIPRAALSGLSAPVGGGDGAKVETLTLRVGPKVATSTEDAGMATFSTSET
jgi:hypothetical protein